MVPGDIVKIVNKQGETKFGIIVQGSKKKFMVGEVVTVLVEGEVKTLLKERVLPLN